MKDTLFKLILWVFGIAFFVVVLFMSILKEGLLANYALNFLYLALGGVVIMFICVVLLTIMSIFDK